MATEQSITIGVSDSKTVVPSVTVPFITTSELEVYVGQNKVEKVILDNAGAGYADATNAALEFSGGGGSSAALTVDVANGQVSLDNAGVPTNKGTGYTTAPIVGFGNISGGTAAAARAEIFVKKTVVTDYSISGTSGAATITFTSPLTNGDIVKIKRVTNVASPANTFQSSSSITATALNDSFNQIRHRVEELPDLLTTSLVDGDKGDITVSGNTWTIDNDVITGDKLANHVTINDNNSIKFGTGGDLQILHDNANSIIRHNGTGELYLQCGSGETIQITDLSDPHNVAASFDPDGAVTLHYGTGSAPKLTTASGGISVTGSVTSSTLTDNRVLFGGTSGIIEDSGNLTFDGTTLTVTGAAAVDNITIDDRTISTSSGDVTINPASTLNFTTDIVAFKNPGGTVSFEVGNGATGDHAALIDLISDSTNTDYGGRIIRGGGANASFQIKNKGTGSIDIVPLDASGGDVRLYYANSALRLQTTAGGCTVTGSVTETSDIALKENIQPLSNSLANLKQLNGYSYKFKDTGAKSLGLTAQEVEKVYPDLVEGEEGKKGLRYSGLIAPLLEAIKELSTEVETLKTKVAALEAK